MNITDKSAKAAAKAAAKYPSRCLLPLFVSRSSNKSDLDKNTIDAWNGLLDDLEDRDQRVFRRESGFYPFAKDRKLSTFVALRPPKWFKSIKRSLMSQLTQMCTNHAPTGEYFKRCVWKYRNKPAEFFQCSCKLPPFNEPPAVQTRDHIIRSCPLFEDARDRLMVRIPRIGYRGCSLGKMVRKKTIEATLKFLMEGPFSRRHAPKEPP